MYHPTSQTSHWHFSSHRLHSNKSILLSSMPTTSIRWRYRLLQDNLLATHDTQKMIIQRPRRYFPREPPFKTPPTMFLFLGRLQQIWDAIGIRSIGVGLCISVLGYCWKLGHFWILLLFVFTLIRKPGNDSFGGYNNLILWPDF